jgi:hypothetical protein
MKAGLMARIAKLELQRQTTEASRSRVVWLGLDGKPEPGAFDQVSEGPIVCLPRKAKTAEEWVERVRSRWEGKDPATVTQQWCNERPWLEK